MVCCWPFSQKSSVHTSIPFLEPRLSTSGSRSVAFVRIRLRRRRKFQKLSFNQEPECLPSHQLYRTGRHLSDGKLLRLVHITLYGQPFRQMKTTLPETSRPNEKRVSRGPLSAPFSDFGSGSALTVFTIFRAVLSRFYLVAT